MNDGALIYSPVHSLVRSLAYFAAVLATCSFTLAESGPPKKVFSSGDKQTSLLELFSSEGCSSCPPAESAVYSLADEPGLWKEFVPVSFHVSYWDKLGWVDRLGNQQFTARQYAYAKSWGTSRVYTPEFVLDGQENPAGTGALKRGEKRPEPGKLVLTAFDGNEFQIEFIPMSIRNAGAVDDYTLTQPKEIAERSLVAHTALLGNGLVSKVTAGENRGETLRHNFVALKLQSVPLKYDRQRKSYTAAAPWMSAPEAGAQSFSVAAWITALDSVEPIQAIGGDL